MKRSNLQNISLASLSASISAVALIATANVAMAAEPPACDYGRPCSINTEQGPVEGACGTLEGGCACLVFAEGGAGMFEMQVACIDW